MNFLDFAVDGAEQGISGIIEFFNGEIVGAGVV